MGRLIALLILIIPGIVAAIGIKLMRDALFNEVSAIFNHLVLQFICGLIFFIVGLTFIGGFILHRDRKRNLTQ
ncbi:DUF2627 domain-containing protein [Salinibacillus xinjiangensis]|uniref:DUF2627 family protein n=1 Tax=Salinibacillus xinjiangensis TaxID=1229268 RepID=A0A6G1X6F8_9BACI|nr:DUF2627 domain-containing protein [Salinibacillus xinjiangensis]MRG86522.1 DUF2627 family protein [Salinibacillus xinjiangensis]